MSAVESNSRHLKIREIVQDGEPIYRIMFRDTKAGENDEFEVAMVPDDDAVYFSNQLTNTWIDLGHVPMLITVLKRLVRLKSVK